MTSKLLIVIDIVTSQEVYKNLNSWINDRNDSDGNGNDNNKIIIIKTIYDDCKSIVVYASNVVETDDTPYTSGVLINGYCWI